MKHKGIRKRDNGKWTAYIHINNQQVILGTYDTIQEAEVSRKIAYDAYRKTKKQKSDKRYQQILNAISNGTEQRGKTKLG